MQQSRERESSQSRGGNQYNKDQSRNEDRRQSRNGTRDRENRPRSESRSRSSSHVSTNRDRHRCYRFNEYDHFARECPNIVTDGSSDEMGDSLLQMLDPDDATAFLSNHNRRDGTSHVKIDHNKVLTTTQGDFVTKS